MKKNYPSLMLIPLACVCLAVTACKPNNSNDSSPAAAISPHESSTTPEATPVTVTSIPSSGNPVATAGVTNKSFAAGPAQAGSPVLTYAEIIAAYPVLAGHATYLAGIDSVIQTDAPGFDLYSGGVLVMTLHYNSTTHVLTVINSTQPFTADAITYAVSSVVPPQGAAVQSITFEMSDCVQPPPVQNPKDKVPVTPPPVCAAILGVIEMQQVTQQQQQDCKTGKDCKAP